MIRHLQWADSEEREKTPMMCITYVMMYSRHMDVTDLGKQGRHLQSQFLVDREVSCCDGLVGLIDQEQPLSLGLTSHLRREVEPANPHPDTGRVLQKVDWWRMRSLHTNSM